MAKKYYDSKRSGQYARQDHGSVDNTVVKDWSSPDSDYPMRNDGNGSMSYMSDKKKIAAKDAKMVRSQMRPQSGEQ